jgi:predicted DNA-binding transcriptional regulator YafY
MVNTGRGNKEAMSAIKNMLRLLMIFEDGTSVYTAEELANIIGVSTRQIRNYINELRDYGYVIDGVVAAGGGYRSAGQYLNIPLSVTKIEISSLKRMIEFMESNDVFLEYEDIKNLYYKLLRQKNISISPQRNFDYRLQFKQKHYTSEKQRINELIKAIDDKRAVEIQYFSANSQKLNERIIHPYKLQIYQGANYIHAYCEKASEYRVFKLIRIKEFQVLDKCFVRDEKLVKHLEKQNFGLFNEKMIKVKLEFRYPYNEFAKEIILGEEQQTEEIDESKTRISASVTNETELIGWLMSFGDSVKVIEPERLQETIVERAKAICRIYE